MSEADEGAVEQGKWDPAFTEAVAHAVGPLIKRYFRAEVDGLERVPAVGGALVVSNHSGGMFTPDVIVFGSAFYECFGYDRPLFTLGHDRLFVGPLDGWLTRVGVIHASPANAERALRSAGVVIVFPGGDYDAYRPTSADHRIDFQGRTGYVRTALSANVPIVPVVSIGAQQGQLFLTRGTGLAKRLGLKRLRVDILPVSVGLPFGLSVFFPPNLPLPTKISTRVLDPIDVRGRFGAHPDVDEVDAYVRGVMQSALGELAEKRRFPVLG